MTTALQLLFTAIGQTRNESELRSQLAPQIGEYFAAKRWGICFFDRLGETLNSGKASQLLKQLPLANRQVRQVLQAGLSIERNPVVRYLVEHHAPVHEAQVVSPKVWTMICPRPDHWHVLAGPIVSQGQLIGVVGCTREQLMPSFNTQDLADLSGICLHLSVWAATVRTQTQLCKSDRLTPREVQIAELVALGRTNAEVGRELWITENSVKQALKRMFRKLEVSSRAEMVAQLAWSKQYLPN